MRKLHLVLLLLTHLSLHAQYTVDRKGVLRDRGGREAAFFGVNYTVPFAHGYRAHRVRGVDHEAAIRADVYAMQRLGLDAFRVHVWDTEITDSLGGLKENEHLRLYDFLLAELKRRGIKTILTPLAFWGPGYPEPDSNTGSFSSKWNKRQVLVTEAAIRAQETYIGQLLRHRNPYTGTTYGEDRDIIALEVNNEPHHSGPLSGAADYIRRMVAAVRGAGWTKPVFYNISESPSYAAAVAAADIQGVSFQWYPTGLVASRTLQGNFLPHVDRYRIPFDTIPAFRNKARMVYEFDAGDIIQPYMYPAMARSFRTAGFQWATQFAYDPLHTADVNTEYQTHYVNLLYTPSKAVSLRIAAEAFRRLPRGKAWGTYPQDTLFAGFRLSYGQQLSEYAGDTAFYYSNTTDTRPPAPARLRHLAGVGHSPLVRYSGSGAYFLDRLASGAWRLEVLPDVVEIADPFGPARPSRPVRRLGYRARSIEIFLPDLGPAFLVQALNEGNAFAGEHRAGGVQLQPGVYLLSRTGVPVPKGVNAEFYTPARKEEGLHLAHTPPVRLTAGRAGTLNAVIAGDSLQVTAELRHSNGAWKSVPAQATGPHRWTVELPADLLQPGALQYRFLLRQEGRTTTYPGGYNGDPYAWNAPVSEWFETLVVPAAAPVVLLDPQRDRNAVVPWIGNWNEQSLRYTVSGHSGRMALRLEDKGSGVRESGFQVFAGGLMREAAPDSAQVLVLRYRTGGLPRQMRVSLIDRDGRAYGAALSANPAEGVVRIPLSSLTEGPMLLLPRPYPGFGHLEFDAEGTRPFDLSRIERLELRVWGSGYVIEIEEVSLQRS